MGVICAILRQIGRKHACWGRKMGAKFVGLRRASQWDEIERFHNQDHHTTHVSRTFGEEQLGPIRSQSKVCRNGVGVFVCGTAS